MESKIHVRGENEWRQGPMLPRARFAVMAIGNQPGQETVVEYHRSWLVAVERLRRWQRALNDRFSADSTVTMCIRDRWAT